MNKIEVLGDQIKEVSIPFAELPNPLRISEELKTIKLVVGNECSGCMNRLGDAFARLGVDELARMGRLGFVVGRDAHPVKGSTDILVGVCTARHKTEGIYLGDCPPMTADVIEAMRYAAGEITERRYHWDTIGESES